MKLMILLYVSIIPFYLAAQPSWKRNEVPVSLPVNLFHSSQTANLPTTGTLQKGNFMYEISHRFASLTSGYDGLYGLDGPVTMRTALSYGVTDDLMATIGRSNIQDNLDMRLKYKLNGYQIIGLQHVLAIHAGIAFNTETFTGLKKRSAFDMESVQYYGQLIYNTMFFDDKLGFGLVPSFIYNSFIFSSDYGTEKKYTFSLPVYAQYYFNRLWSIFIEYNPVLGGWKGNLFFDAGSKFRSHNSVGAGMAIETGGHVFFLFMTNNDRLNPSQYLTGASGSAKNKTSWRVAFGITREL